MSSVNPFLASTSESYNARDAALHFDIHIAADQQSTGVRPRSEKTTRTDVELARISKQKNAGAERKVSRNAENWTKIRNLTTTRRTNLSWEKSVHTWSYPTYRQ